MGVWRNPVNSPLTLRLIEVLDRRSENRMTEFGMLAQAFEFAKINGVKGDCFEFGVWRGKTFGYARTMARRYRVAPITFRAFDSFAGLPRSAGANGMKSGARGNSPARSRSSSASSRRRGLNPASKNLWKGSTTSR